MASIDLRGAYGLLRRAMEQQSLQQQQGAGFGSTPSVASEDNSPSYGSPQGGLPGRLQALQGEQSQFEPVAANPGQAPSESQNPNFRQLSRAPSARTYLNRLPPYGMLPIVTDGLDAIVQAVQGSIDATSVPSTEEEAFRQNQGRELGPIGAWNAVSLLGPKVPAGTGGIFARPLAGRLLNGQPSAPTVARIAARDIDGPIANTSVPAISAVSPSTNLAPEPQSPLAVANAIIEMGRRRKPLPPSRPDDPDWYERFLNQERERVAARNASFRKSSSGNGGGNGPGDFCSTRYTEEEKRCYTRSDEYPHWDFLTACKDRAAERRSKCVSNGGEPDPAELGEWGPNDEEVYRNLSR